MPQIRQCQNCKKILQINEIHNCMKETPIFVKCDKCGMRYDPKREHFCPAAIK